MKFKAAALFFLAIFVLASCQKPECRTRAGKQKVKHYNSIQYR